MIHKFLLTVALVLIGIVQGGAQEPFTFAQITDIHLNSNDPKPLEYLMTSIDDMNQNPAIDFVLSMLNTDSIDDTFLSRHILLDSKA